MKRILFCLMKWLDWDNKTNNMLNELIKLQQLLNHKFNNLSQGLLTMNRIMFFLIEREKIILQLWLNLLKNLNLKFYKWTKVFKQ